MTPDKGGAHGKKHEFIIQTQVADHPITAGLPTKWMHATDELYDRLRGSAKMLLSSLRRLLMKEPGGR